MNPIAKVASALQFVANHPVNRHRKFQAALEWGFIQLASRMVPGDICVEFPNQSRLLIPPHMKGAAFYIAPGLCEFDEMAFVMHFLRSGDVFFDVGANIGAYTVLAGAVAGANVVCFEPSPDTFRALERNVRLNHFESRAKLFNVALGRTGGEIQFTSGLGTENYVVKDASSGQTPNTVRVKVMTLDQMLSQGVPKLMKMDVEGFETEVFGGAEQLLKRPELSAISMERAGNAGRYGYDETALHKTIRENGFSPCQYDPFGRRLSAMDPEANGDIIYIRDMAAANAILTAAPPFKIGPLSV
jgi:FkbM family methyltransferase